MVPGLGMSRQHSTDVLDLILDDIRKIDSGEIKIRSRSILGMSDDALSDYRARFMGFVFQSFNLLPVLTARENVELPLVLAGVNG